MVKIFKVNKPLLSDLLSFPLMGLDCSIFFHHSPSLEKDLCCTVEPALRSPLHPGHFFVPTKQPYIFLWENPIIPATSLIRPTATLWNPNLSNPLQFYPVYTTTRTSYVHLSKVNIVCSDWSFSVFKLNLHSGCLLKNRCLERLLHIR